jgi:hypothetical protein
MDLLGLLDLLERPLDHLVATLAIQAGGTRDILTIEDRVHQDHHQAMEATMEATHHLLMVEAILLGREEPQDLLGPATLRDQPAPGQVQGMNQRRWQEVDSPAVRMAVLRVQSRAV